MPFSINVDLTIRADQTITELLTRIVSKLDVLISQGEQMKINVTSLLAAVAVLTSVDKSVLALITTMAQNQKDLAKQLADAIAANDPAAIAEAQKAINDSATEIMSQADALTKAVTDNTPAAIPPPPAPEQTPQP